MLADLIVDGAAPDPLLHIASTLIPGAYEAEDFFPNLGASGHWLHFNAAPLRDRDGNVVGAIETLRDVTDRRVAENALRQAHDNLENLVARRTAQLAEVNQRLEDDIRQRQIADAELRRRNIELTELNDRLSMAQQQLIQSEKLASIGQLAAGVAHEINNPIGYIFSNVGTLQTYLDQLFAMLAAYEQAEASVAAPDVAARLRALREEIDLDFLRDDIPALMNESKEGIVRVRHIVQDLKDFSRVDANLEWSWADLRQGIDSTLNIVSNEVKYKADVVKDYGDDPAHRMPAAANQPGGAEPRRQRGARHRPGARHHHRAHRRGRRPRSVAGGGRQRQRHRAGRAVAHLRSLLHHQGGRQGHGTGAVAGLRHRAKTPRPHRGRHRGGTRQHLPRPPARAPHQGDAMTRLLLLDDEVHVLQALKRELRLQLPALQIECFSNPYDAINRVCEHEFDVAIADYRMPEMSGVPFCRR